MTIRLSAVRFIIFYLWLKSIKKIAGRRGSGEVGKGGSGLAGIIFINRPGIISFIPDK